MEKKVIAFPHPALAKGGPGSFQIRFSNFLKKNGWDIVYPEDNVTPDVIFLVGATRKFKWLIQNKRKGIPVVMRLAGLNWLFRLKKVGTRKQLLDRYRNFALQITRAFIADAVVYQSEFGKQWWHRKGIRKITNENIIHNAIDLSEFHPPKKLERGPKKLICVEGHLDYSPYAIDLINYLDSYLQGNPNYAGTFLYGRFSNPDLASKLNSTIKFEGYLKRSEITSVYQNAVYLSLDVNAICPNAVIEALASGTPVLGFDSGALKELVSDDAGRVVNFGGDPWKLDAPNFNNLGEAANEVFNRWEDFANGARKLAEQKYDIEEMVQEYLRVIDSVKR